MGKVCELDVHLAESCEYEPVACSNAPAGCTELVLREDAARHSVETCAYRDCCCKFCSNPFAAAALPEHEGSCPEAQLMCSNPGCGVTVARGGMAEHRGVCEREEVECPCPGCEERMVRGEVDQHVEASGAVHLRRAWGRAAELEEKVEEQKAEMSRSHERNLAQDLLIEDLQERDEEQTAEIAELRTDIEAQEKRGEALTRVFTWSTNSAWRFGESADYTFTDGVRGGCWNGSHDSPDYPQRMAFELEEGSDVCTVHYKCLLLGKDNRVLRVVCGNGMCDFHEPPVTVIPNDGGRGQAFRLNAEDKVSAVRTDGSIKLRMVVHLYLPE